MKGIPLFDRHPKFFIARVLNTHAHSIIILKYTALYLQLSGKWFIRQFVLAFSYNLINFLVNRFQNYIVIENVVKLKQIHPHWYLSKSCHNKINIVRIFGFHIMNWWKILIRIYSQQIRSNHNSIFQCLCLYVNILYMNVERFYQRMMMNEHFLPVECGKKKIHSSSFEGAIKFPEKCIDSLPMWKKCSFFPLLMYK